MKALVFNGPKDIRYETFDDPGITDDRNLIIKVDRCSICGSDLHLYHGAAVGEVDYSKPIERFCTGHEAIGEVVEVGKAVTKHSVGDRIMVSAITGCGQCRRCLAGQLNQCENAAARGSGLGVYGIHPSLQGGHADYLEVRFADTASHRIPDGITDEQAILMTDALSAGFYGVKQADVKQGDTVAVIGQGPVGLMAAEAAIAVGASRVYTIDPVAERRQKSLTFGAIPLDPDTAMEQILEDTKGLGVDAVVEAVGAASTVSRAIDLARFGGRVAIIGIMHPDVVVPMQLAQLKSLVVQAGITSVADNWSELIALVTAGRIKGDGVFTHHFSLSDGAEAYRLFDSHESGVMKVLLTP